MFDVLGLADVCGTGAPEEEDTPPCLNKSQAMNPKRKTPINPPTQTAKVRILPVL